MNVMFPKDTELGIKYYKVHYMYLLNVLKFTGSRVACIPGLHPIDQVRFPIVVNNTKVVIDFSDHLAISPSYADEVCFKYHYSDDHHSGYPKIFPIGPVSFHDWSTYYKLSVQLVYSAQSRILNNNRPGGAALKRRMMVRDMLRGRYGEEVDTTFHPNQKVFWNLITDCFVSVCVPGARNDILDRGQFQYIGLGCCTISPKLNTVLAGHNKLEPGVHYVECASDYSDLIERIEWCRENKGECVRIGQQAKELFRETSVPAQICRWMMECLRKV